MIDRHLLILPLLERQQESQIKKIFPFFDPNPPRDAQIEPQNTIKLQLIRS